MQDRNAPPLNPLPMIVWVLALPIIAMEVVVGLGGAGIVGGMEGAGWRLQALERFVFSPPLMQAMIDRGDYPLLQIMRLVTYPFVHGATTHALFVVVILLALGKMVGEVFRWWAVSLIGFLLGIQLLFGLLFGGGWEWVADLTGFAAGFLLSFVVSPGGWSRVRDRLRQR